MMNYVLLQWNRAMLSIRPISQAETCSGLPRVTFRNRIIRNDTHTHLRFLITNCKLFYNLCHFQLVRAYFITLITLNNYKPIKFKPDVLEAINKLKLQNNKNHFCIPAVHVTSMQLLLVIAYYVIVYIHIICCCITLPVLCRNSTVDVNVVCERHACLYWIRPTLSIEGQGCIA